MVDPLVPIILECHRLLSPRMQPGLFRTHIDRRSRCGAAYFEWGGGNHSGFLAAGAEEPEHDFGPVLAGTRVLQHDFILSNPTSRPVRLLKAEARTPCCSKIGPLPKSIAPGSTVKVPITYRTGFETGPRGVEFTIVTDAPSRPIWRLAVRARFFAEFEVQQAGDSFLSTGQPGEQMLHVVCRRHATEGRTAPVGIDVRPPLEATLGGPVVESDEEELDGVIRSSRDIEVRLPAVDRPGPQRQEIVLRWDKGETSTYAVNWMVNASIQANPPALVVKSSDGLTRRTVRLSAGDQAFRIRQVSGPLLAEKPESSSQAKRAHELSLAIDPGRLSDGGVSDIRITTDHPNQREVTISIHVSTDE